MKSYLFLIFALISCNAKPVPDFFDDIKNTGSKIIDFGSNIFKKSTTTIKPTEIVKITAVDSASTSPVPISVSSLTDSNNVGTYQSTSSQSSTPGYEIKSTENAMSSTTVKFSSFDVTSDKSTSIASSTNKPKSDIFDDLKNTGNKLLDFGTNVGLIRKNEKPIEVSTENNSKTTQMEQAISSTSDPKLTSFMSNNPINNIKLSTQESTTLGYDIKSTASDSSLAGEIKSTPPVALLANNDKSTTPAAIYSTNSIKSTTASAMASNNDIKSTTPSTMASTNDIKSTTHSALSSVNDVKLSGETTISIATEIKSTSETSIISNYTLNAPSTSKTLLDDIKDTGKKVYEFASNIFKSKNDKAVPEVTTSDIKSTTTEVSTSANEIKLTVADIITHQSNDFKSTSELPTSNHHHTISTTELNNFSLNMETTSPVASSTYIDADGLPKPCPTDVPESESRCKSVIAVSNHSCPEGQKIHNGKCKKIFISNTG